MTVSKSLLSNKIYGQFIEALKERASKGHYAEITFIGVNSAVIKEHKKVNNFLEVTVDFVSEIITSIKDKDKKEWENFITSKEKLHNKDELTLNKNLKKITKKIDLHGYALEEANKTIDHFIKNSFNNNIHKIIVITGKGLHSQNEKNPYVSKNLSILKYSVPEYIENNPSLMKKIINITDANIEDGGSGAFYIYLKKNN